MEQKSLSFLEHSIHKQGVGENYDFEKLKATCVRGRESGSFVLRCVLTMFESTVIERERLLLIVVSFAKFAVGWTTFRARAMRFTLI